MIDRVCSVHIIIGIAAMELAVAGGACADQSSTSTELYDTVVDFSSLMHR